MVFTFLSFYIIQFIFCFLIILVATIQDFKERQVFDFIWLIACIIGTILHLIGIYLLKYYIWKNLFLNILFAFIFIGISMFPKLFNSSFLMGPADLFGIIIIAYIFPFHAPWVSYYNLTLFYIPSIFGFLTNTFLALGLFLSSNFCINAIKIAESKRNNENSNKFFGEFKKISIFKKFLFMFLGKRIKLESLNNYRFVKFLEDYDEDKGIWVPDFDLSYDNKYSREEMKKFNQSFNKLGLEHIWVSPLMPLMFFFLLSLILTTGLGNLIFKFLEIIIY